jgi:hypothetical protein
MRTSVTRERITHDLMGDTTIRLVPFGAKTEAALTVLRTELWDVLTASQQADVSRLVSLLHRHAPIRDTSRRWIVDTYSWAQARRAGHDTVGRAGSEAARK